MPPRLRPAQPHDRASSTTLPRTKRIRRRPPAAKSSPRSGTLFQLLFRLVHTQVEQSIRILVEFAANVLERDVADLAHERARLHEERLQPFVLHAVLAAHLLHEELGIGLDEHPAVLVLHGPSQGGKQAVVLGDVVGRDAEAAVQLVEQAAARVHDVDAVSRGSRVAAGASVDVRRDQDAWDCDAGVGTKYRIRWQLSHWTMA